MASAGLSWSEMNWRMQRLGLALCLASFLLGFCSLGCLSALLWAFCGEAGSLFHHIFSICGSRFADGQPGYHCSLPCRGVCMSSKGAAGETEQG